MGLWPEWLTNAAADLVTSVTGLGETENKVLADAQKGVSKNATSDQLQAASDQTANLGGKLAEDTEATSQILKSVGRATVQKVAGDKAASVYDASIKYGEATSTAQRQQALLGLAGDTLPLGAAGDKIAKNIATAARNPGRAVKAVGYVVKKRVGKAYAQAGELKNQLNAAIANGAPNVQAAVVRKLQKLNGRLKDAGSQTQQTLQNLGDTVNPLLSSVRSRASSAKNRVKTAYQSAKARLTNNTLTQ